MTKSTITRDRLAEIAQFGFSSAITPANDFEIKELARMALAAMDSEPVAWTWQHREQWHVTNDEERARDLAWDGVKVEPLYRHAQPAPVVVPEGLNPETTDLVLRFASALADKLYKAEQKYGRSTDWMKDDWYDDCLQSLWEHIEKGDPRDVAAYCAFMWYHGWVTTDYDRNVQNACRAAMLQSGNSPAQSQGWIPVSERMPEMGEHQCYVLAADFKNHYWPNIPNTQVGVYGDWFGDGNPAWDDGDGEDLHLKEVTHWMPLPAAPQEVKGE